MASIPMDQREQPCDRLLIVVKKLATFISTTRASYMKLYRDWFQQKFRLT